MSVKFGGFDFKKVFKPLVEKDNNLWYSVTSSLFLSSSERASLISRIFSISAFFRTANNVAAEYHKNMNKYQDAIR